MLIAPEIQQAFRVPPLLLVTQIAEGDPYFLDEMQQHFPGYLPEVRQLLADAGKALLDRVKEAPPYPGAKPYYLIDAQLDDADAAAAIVRATADALPAPKMKPATKPKQGGRSKGKKKPG